MGLSGGPSAEKRREKKEGGEFVCLRPAKAHRVDIEKRHLANFTSSVFTTFGGLQPETSGAVGGPGCRNTQTWGYGGGPYMVHIGFSYKL